MQKGMNLQNGFLHYYGHPEKSEQIVKEQVISHIMDKGQYLYYEDVKRLLYYVKYHDDRVSLREKHLKRHLQLVSLEDFKKLMMLEVADAMAHVRHPAIEERIKICSKWTTDYAEEVYNRIKM